MLFAVLRFPGSSCDEDLLRAGAAALGGRAEVVSHTETRLPPEVSAVGVAGGASTGDDRSAGAAAALSPIIPALREFVAAGGPVLGVGDGFRILCEAGLLPGTLEATVPSPPARRDVHVRVEGAPTPFTHAIAAGRTLRLPVAPPEWRYVHPDAAALDAAGQVVFRYVDAEGGVTDEANPSGSERNIAGVANVRGNVVGLVAHPEQAAAASHGGSDGQLLFESLAAALAAEAGARPAGR